MDDLKVIRQRLERARAEVSALCKGKRWQMTIPARRDEDSDLVIGDALRDGYQLVKRVEELYAVCDRLHALLDQGAVLSAETVVDGKTVLATLYDTMEPNS